MQTNYLKAFEFNVVVYDKEKTPHKIEGFIVGSSSFLDLIKKTEKVIDTRYKNYDLEPAIVLCTDNVLAAAKNINGFPVAMLEKQIKEEGFTIWVLQLAIVKSSVN